MVMSVTVPLSVFTVFAVKGAPTGFSVELCVTPVRGCVRRGEARL